MPKGVYKHKQNQGFQIGHKLGMIGKYHSKETKEKIRESCRKTWQRKIKEGYQISQEVRERARILNAKGIIGMKGRQHTEATKRKMSEAHKGEENFWYGKKHSKEYKEMMSEAHKGKHSKEQSNWWKGGISFELYGLEFNDELKARIRQRDNYTCQECGYTEEQLGYRISVHHIDYNKKNNKENNLIS